VSALRDAVADLRRIAFLLERAHEATYRVRAFRAAATAVAGVPTDELRARAEAGTLTELGGVGAVTARTVTESLAGEVPAYLLRLDAQAQEPVATGGEAIRAALRGDCHTHSDWSDGGSPIPEMGAAARDLGHEYLVLTDHSPRLTVARGLSAERLREQLQVVAGLAGELAPLRLLTGIEVDIVDNGGLDQLPELLAELDVVVASVHSKLRMPAAEMTPRMVAAVANPHVDVLGHCTGRNVTSEGRAGRTRAESEFDAELVLPPARISAWRWRSTAARSASTRQNACCGKPWRPDASSRSTPTPMRPASSTGSPMAAPGPPNVTSRRSGSSTPGPLTTCSTGRPITTTAHKRLADHRP